MPRASPAPRDMYIRAGGNCQSPRPVATRGAPRPPVGPASNLGQPTRSVSVADLTRCNCRASVEHLDCSVETRSVLHESSGGLVVSWTPAVGDNGLTSAVVRRPRGMR